MILKNWSVFNKKSEPAEQLEYLIYLSLVRITSTGRIGEFQVWCFTGKRFAERHFSNSNFKFEKCLKQLTNDFINRCGNHRTFLLKLRTYTMKMEITELFY